MRVHYGFDEIRDAWLLHQITKGQHLGDPEPATALSLAVVTVAYAVGGARQALVVAAIVVLANLTTVLLSETVSVARAPLPDQDLWPSNHTTAVAAAALCLPLIFAGRWARPAALLAFAMTMGITLALLLRGTHFLTDLLAAVLVAGFWVVLVAELDATRRPPRPRADPPGPR